MTAPSTTCSPGCNTLASVWVLFIVGLISADVIGRAAFNSPLPGVPEIVRFSIVGMVWLQMAYTLRSGNHLRTDAVPRPHAARSRQRAVLIANSLVGIGLFVLIAWLGWIEMAKSFEIGAFEGEHPVRIPVWPVWAILVGGAALTARPVRARRGPLPARRTARLRTVRASRTRAYPMMDPVTVGALSIAAIFVLILLGFHIGVALAVVSFAGVYLITGKFRVAASILQTTAYNGVNDYVFAVIPLFVVMGLFATQSGATRDLFDAAEALLRRVKGGVGVATVIANAIFAAITGVSVASAAVFSKLAIPEMNRLGYDRKFGLGIVASSALLGMLIPPSILMIVYGVITEESIGRLFAAGIGPGLVVAGVLIATILVWVRIDPGDRRRAKARSRSTVKVSRLDLLDQDPADLRADRAGARRHLRRLLHADRGRRHRRARRAGADPAARPLHRRPR